VLPALPRDVDTGAHVRRLILDRGVGRPVTDFGHLGLHDYRSRVHAPSSGQLPTSSSPLRRTTSTAGSPPAAAPTRSATTTGHDPAPCGPIPAILLLGRWPWCSRTGAEPGPESPEADSVGFAPRRQLQAGARLRRRYGPRASGGGPASGVCGGVVVRGHPVLVFR